MLVKRHKGVSQVEIIEMSRVGLQIVCEHIFRLRLLLFIECSTVYFVALNGFDN